MTDRVLQDQDLDRLGQALISLAQELWVVKDRQRVLEEILSDAGVLESGSVDRYQPGHRLAEELSVERKQLIDNLLAALTADPADSAPD